MIHPTPKAALLFAAVSHTISARTVRVPNWALPREPGTGFSVPRRATQTAVATLCFSRRRGQSCLSPVFSPTAPIACASRTPECKRRGIAAVLPLPWLALGVRADIESLNTARILAELLERTPAPR